MYKQSMHRGEDDNGYRFGFAPNTILGGAMTKSGPP